MKHVVVIGAGIGGLAAANLLAVAGYRVSVYEKHQTPGGRAGLLERDGFCFDTGPSWYLMPEVFEHYFGLLGESASDHLQLERLDPAYTVFFEKHASLTVHADPALDRRTFEAIEPGAGDRLTDYVRRSGIVYRTSLDHFLYTNFERPGDLLRPGVLRQLPAIARVAGQPIDRYVSRYFRDPRLRQIMEYPMVFLGTSPYQAPAIYSLMSHLDFTQGVFYPQGGMFRIIEAMTTIGERLGVEYHYGADVSAILTEPGGPRPRSKRPRASGIRLADGSEVVAGIVISNADLHFTETSLLAPEHRTYDEKYWSKKQAGPSALLMYLGVKGSLPQLSHHNLLFADDWQANFNAIFEKRNWPEPASLYICKPSQTDSSVAPAGHENLFVLVPAPADPAARQTTGNQTAAGTAAGSQTDARGDLESRADGYLDQIADMIGAPDLRQRIVTRQVVGPYDFAAQFNAWQGTALGLSHLLRQSALFRPSNRSKKLDDLYYVGANTTPGVGLPMCLIGAELVYKRIIGDRSSGRLTGPIASLVPTAPIHGRSN